MLGATQSGVDLSLLSSLDGGTEENPDTLLTFLVVAMILALGVGLALRTKAVPVALPAASRSRPVAERPVLFLDVDGVLALNPLVPHPPPGSHHGLELGMVYIPDRVGELVRMLESRFDLVWASGWEHWANRSLPKLLGLEEDLPVITFGRDARFGSADWKTKRISRYARGRPAAWVDDNFDDSHAQWARRRKAPTLILPIDSHKGLSEDERGGADRMGGQRGHGAPARAGGARPAGVASTATGIRTPVSAVRGRRPSPLDDGGAPAGDSSGTIRRDLAKEVDWTGASRGKGESCLRQGRRDAAPDVPGGVFAGRDGRGCRVER